MKKFSLQSLGGQARGRQQREIALTVYYASPNFCQHCEIRIEVPDNVKVNQIKSKKFCSRECFWQSRIGKVNGHPKEQPKPKLCGRCKNEITPLITTKKFCDSCRYASYKSLDNVSKGELFAKSRNWQSARSSLRRHAYRTFRRTKKSLSCHVCGYSNHAEIAHCRSVSSFDDDTLIGVINAPQNLVALCPNHHWELDNNILVLEAKE